MAIAPGLKPAAQGALLTAGALFGGLAGGAALGFLAFNTLPGHATLTPNAMRISVGVVPALGGVLVGSALWGALMGRLAGQGWRRRMGLAGILGFVLPTIVLGIGLNVVEPLAVGRLGALLPIQRLFTLLFVPSVFVIAGVGAWAIGQGLGRQRLAWALLWRVGLAAAVGFLAVNLLMEALGWVVGAPNADLRFTMLTVLFAGSLGAALAGGGTLGWTVRAEVQILSPRQTKRTS